MLFRSLPYLSRWEKRRIVHGISSNREITQMETPTFFVLLNMSRCIRTFQSQVLIGSDFGQAVGPRGRERCLGCEAEDFELQFTPLSERSTAKQTSGAWNGSTYVKPSGKMDFDGSAKCIISSGKTRKE